MDMIEYENTLFGSENYVKAATILVNSVFEFDKVKDTVVISF